MICISEHKIKNIFLGRKYKQKEDSLFGGVRTLGHTISFLTIFFFEFFECFY